MSHHWIVFDLDGTLLDSNHVWTMVDEKFLAQRGRTATQEYLDYVAHAIYPTAARFTKEYYQLDESEESIMDSWTALAREAYQYHVPLKEGAAEYLSRCAARGERLALFTASFPELCYLALRRHNIERFFERIVFAQDLGLEKRNPKAFAVLAETLGVQPSACVLFDDSPQSCLAAKKTGLQVVGVLDSFFASAEAEVRANSHRCISSFSDLLDDSSGLFRPSPSVCRNFQ